MSIHYDINSHNEMKIASRRTRRQFVTNHGDKPAPVVARFFSLGCNAKGALVRNEMLEGKPHLVVPVVMILEGVHCANKGAVYYPGGELEDSTMLWNGRPVVVYHPKGSDGKGVPAAITPETLSAHKIGVIMNTRYDGKGPVPRLVAEAWLEEERVRAVDDRILTAINEKKILELSTGLFSDNEQVEGEWEGEKYTSIARNYKPDHLAILPDQTGACSVADGAGFLRNEAAALTGQRLPSEDVESLRAFIVQKLQGEKKGPIADILKKPALADFVENELAFEEIRSALYGALEKKFPPPSGTDAGYSYPYVEAVYEGFCIFCMGGKLYRINYSATDAGVKLTGEPVGVTRVTEYRSVSLTGNAARQPTKEQNGNTMNKKELVDGLIANCGYAEADREKLMAMTEDTLATLKSAGERLTANAGKKETAAAPATPAKVTAETVLNADQQQALAYGQRKMSEDKARHIATITGNAKNKFTKEQLQAKPIEELEMLSELAAAAAPATPAGAPNFMGNGAAVATLAANATGDEEPLVMAGINWSK